MKDNWKKLQKEKIDRKHQLDVKKVISEDTRFMSNIDKRINNIKNVIDDPDVYNVNIASRERLNKVYDTVLEVLKESKKTNQTTIQICNEIAEKRLNSCTQS